MNPEQEAYIDFTISLKAYSDGPLQLSTDKNAGMFSRLMQARSDVIRGKAKIAAIFSDPAFKEFNNINVLPLIYDEKNKRCNIMVFDFVYARNNTCEIKRLESGSGRKHPAFRFFDNSDGYICEVRYGDATANALQRGLWTHTKNALPYFDSVTNGWIDYSDNLILVQLFSHALVSTANGHKEAVEILKADIQSQKDKSRLKD